MKSGGREKGERREEIYALLAPEWMWGMVDAQLSISDSSVGDRCQRLLAQVLLPQRGSIFIPHLEHP